MTFPWPEPSGRRAAPRRPHAGRVAWTVGLLAAPLLGLWLIFGLTDDSLVDYQNSPVARQYTAVELTAEAEQAEQAETIEYPTRYGRPGGPSTLVLYDDRSGEPEEAEMYAIAAANLATHFGEAAIVTIDAYTDGLMAAHDAAIFLGTDHQSVLPQELLDDVRVGATPVLWIGENAEHLEEGASPDGGSFAAQYGWEPNNPVRVVNDRVQHVSYKDQVLMRVPTGMADLYAPRIVNAEAVEVLALGVCAVPTRGPDAVPVGGTGTCVGDEPADPLLDGGVPWVIRSGNLTYMTDLPLNYIDRSQDYLVFADLYYELLDSDVAPVRQAAVRVEDVGPQADPEDLRSVADYLSGEGVPFQVAVIPVMIDRTPSGRDWVGLTLLDSPRVVEALTYMQERGGTLVQHGTTHQYGAGDNPYSGRSGEDYEFYGYGCSRVAAPPFEWEPCAMDSWVRKSGPVARDSVSDHRARIEQGRQIMIDAGLGEPGVFVTPHYTASPNAYTAIRKVYPARYEQTEYYAGMISGGQTSAAHSYGQVFPYSVQDVYGGTVYPENLQNVTEHGQNNHPPRPPQVLLDRARGNLVVRESIASFYFHPFLDLAYLDELVTGIRELGYEFVPATELR